MGFTTLIDVDALAKLPHAVLLDCRFDLRDPDAGRRAYVAGHIPGACYADLNRTLAAPVTAATGRHPLPDPRALAQFLSAAGVGGEAQDAIQIVAYDDANGSFAARAWYLCKWLGHDAVAVLDGGFTAWRAAGGSVVAGAEAGTETGAPDSAAPAHPSGDFVIRLRPELMVKTAEVLANIATRARLLIDARAPERFSGSVEPLDPVAGHVPGAVNHPFSANLTPAGQFLPAEDLRRLWLERLETTAPADVIAMCGSGVTACHNLLALERAGLTGAKLYPGSWSEWVRDADRPVARGESGAG